HVTTTVGGRPVAFVEETDYPFEGSVIFTCTDANRVTFPLHLRIPGWCKGAGVSVNGSPIAVHAGDSVVVINRTWGPGDRVELILPMTVYTRTWHENAVSVERGPVVYALKMGEKTSTVRDTTGYGTFEEIRPTTPWN